MTVLKYSLVIPIYKNKENIASLFTALDYIDAELSGDCEFVFVIDGSPDDSKNLIEVELRSRNFSSQVINLSRNYGSFTAIRVGMTEASGEYISVMAADLQEPPELIFEFFKSLENNEADLVLGQRTSREDPIVKKILSSLYWKLYTRLIQPDIPEGGVDIFGCNRKVRDSIASIEEGNSSLIAQLFWVGFTRKYIPYQRRERKEGKSAWGLRRRFKYMLDSIFSYSDLPILLVLVIGLVGVSISVFYMLFLLIVSSLGMIDTPGFATQTILITLFGSSILFSQGILGCYIWRCLENSKKRPLYFIDSKDKYN